MCMHQCMYTCPCLCVFAVCVPQLSDEDSDLELSSIEEVSAEPVGVRRSSDIGGTSGTSVWSSSASRPGGWAGP